MPNPIVSIVIATYNRPEVLKKCIQSVFQQSYTDWILYIIGDDCSPTTAEMLKELIMKKMLFTNKSKSTNIKHNIKQS